MSLVAPFLGHDVGLYTQGNYDGSSPVVPGDEMKFSVCACVCVCVCVVPLTVVSTVADLHVSSVVTTTMIRLKAHDSQLRAVDAVDGVSTGWVADAF